MNGSCFAGGLPIEPEVKANILEGTHRHLYACSDSSKHKRHERLHAEEEEVGKHVHFTITANV
jgi:hypothetical protein